MSVSALLKAEVTAKVEPVTEEEIDAFSQVDKPVSKDMREVRSCKPAWLSGRLLSLGPANCPTDRAGVDTA
jgi:hypothetical protein